jgi:hypothetical protein
LIYKAAAALAEHDLLAEIFSPQSE